MAERPRVAVVHRGRFSGSAPSLIAALAQRVDVEAIDVLPWARDLRLAPARAAAMATARRLPGRPDWSRTVPWSKAVSKRVDADVRRLHPDAVVLVQSYPLIDNTGVPYAVYTDRTVREGQRVDPRFLTPTPADWIDREAAVIRGAVRVFTFGRTAAQSAVDDYGVPAERVEAVGAGPNATRLPLRARSDCARLLFVGIDFERKGGAVLLDALPRVRSRLPNVTLTIVGASPKAVPVGVTVLGRVPPDRVAVAQRDADLQVLPSLAEPYGIAHVEAILSGLPTIGTTVGSQAEIIGDAGRVVPPDDPEALAAAIFDVAAHYDDVVAATLARRGQMQDRWSWSSVAGRILAGLGLADG